MKRLSPTIAIVITFTTLYLVGSFEQLGGLGLILNFFIGVAAGIAVSIVNLLIESKNNQIGALEKVNKDLKRDLQEHWHPGQRGPRRSGRTTRQANKYVEQILRGEYTVVMDHHGTSNASRRLMDIILYRLRYEHGITEGNFVVRQEGAGFNIRRKTKDEYKRTWPVDMTDGK